MLFLCKINNAKALEEYTRGKIIKKKYFKDLISMCCEAGTFETLKWLIDNDRKLITKSKNILYDEYVLKALDKKYENIVGYIIKNKGINNKNYTPIFVMCCSHNLLNLAKIIYSKGHVSIGQIYIQYPFLVGKTNELDKLFSEMYLTETTNEKFIDLCEKGNLSVIKKFYNSHQIMLHYNDYRALFVLTTNKNNSVIDWILSLNLLPENMLGLLFIRFGETQNYKMAKKVYPIVKDLEILNGENKNDLFLDKLACGEIGTIHCFHESNYKLTDKMTIQAGLITLFENEIDYSIDDIEYYYNYYKGCLENKNTGMEIFIASLHSCRINFIEWMHQKWNLFEEPDDTFYMLALRLSCEYLNIDVAKWLANLYYKYQIVTIEDMGTIIGCEYKKLSKDKQIFRKIISGHITGYDQFRSLNIEKILCRKNIDSCCICYNKPFNLLQLNCSHFCCITCLSHWYLSDHGNSQLCPYCKNPIQFDQCYIAKEGANVIMDNINLFNKNHNKKTKKIMSVYNSCFK